MKIYIHSPTADGAKGTAEIEPRNFPQDSHIYINIINSYFDSYHFMNNMKC